MILYFYAMLAHIIKLIYKGHIEGDDAIPEGVIEAPIDIETQDLILISDIVLTDYSFYILCD
jgi:CDP-glycerol glycerophosphotransferase (TagB/SpsB family)